MIEKSLLRVYKDTEDEVILEFDENQIVCPLTIAKHPYLTPNMRYINIQKGNENRWAFIVVYDDGSTTKFYATTTLSIVESRLISEVKSFLYKNQIFTKLNISGSMPKCEILFNPNYNKWQVRLSANQQTEHIFFDVKDEGDCLIKLAEMLNCNARFFQKVTGGVVPVYGVVLERIEKE